MPDHPTTPGTGETTHHLVIGYDPHSRKRPMAGTILHVTDWAPDRVDRFTLCGLMIDGRGWLFAESGAGPTCPKCIARSAAPVSPAEEPRPCPTCDDGAVCLIHDPRPAPSAPSRETTQRESWDIESRCNGQWALYFGGYSEAEARRDIHVLRQRKDGGVFRLVHCHVVTTRTVVEGPTE